MSRMSNDEYQNGRLINGYDYDNQAWVLAGRYVMCGHPESMNCGCYSRAHAGEKTKTRKAEGMKYKINITTRDGELLNIIEINPNDMNWDSNPTKDILVEEIFDEIHQDIKRRN